MVNFLMLYVTKCRISYFTRYLISNLPIDVKSKLNYETSGKKAIVQTNILPLPESADGMRGKRSPLPL